MNPITGWDYLLLNIIQCFAICLFHVNIITRRDCLLHIIIQCALLRCLIHIDILVTQEWTITYMYYAILFKMIRVKKMESCRSKTNTNDIETQNTTIDTLVAAQYLITNISFISKFIFSGESRCHGIPDGYKLWMRLFPQDY